MTTERVGLVIGADASQFRREFQGASREIEKLDRVLNRGSRDGIFSKQDAKDYDAQLSKVRGSVGRLAREYQFVTREVRQMEKEQQKLIASGQKVGQAQKQQLSDLRAAARAQHHALLSAQSQVGGIQGVRDEVGTQSGIGAAGGFIAKKIGPLALAYGAYRAGSWIKSQADQGYSTALQNEMARMQVGRLAGRDPRSGMYRRARGGLERYGRSLAYTTAETLQMHQAGLQASGVLPWNMAKRNLAMIRGYSLDPGTLFGYQSATRHAGGMMGGGDPSLSLLQGRRMGRFARSLGNEFARSVTGLLSSVSGSRARIGSSVIPGLLGMMGRGMGREFQQSPARTANLLSGLHGTMRSPGGGEAGQALMLRAMGFGKPGVDYLTAYNRARRGIAGKGNIQRMVNQVSLEVKGEREQAHTLHLLSNKQIEPWAAKRLIGLGKAGGLDEDSIKAAMGREKVSPELEAAKSKAHTGFARREIALAERRASLRVQLDPAYRAVFNVQIALLQKIANLLGAKKGSSVDTLKGAMSGRYNFGQILGIYPKTPTAAKGKPKGR